MVFSRSRQLHLAGFVCALALAGCGGGGHRSGPGYAVFNWYVFDVEDTAYSAAYPCLSIGAGSVQLTLKNQATGETLPPVAVDCSAGEIATDNIPAGRYFLRFELYGHPDYYGNTSPLLDYFDTADTDESYPIQGGTNDFRAKWYAPFMIRGFVVNWDLYRLSAPATCAGVGASFVDLDFTVTGTNAVVTTRFNCTDGVSSVAPNGLISLAIPMSATSATWQLYLVDAGNQVLQTIDVKSPVATPAGADVYLGTQVFSL